jgi:hypothetical protein
MRRRRVLQCLGTGASVLAGCASWSRGTDTPTDPSAEEVADVGQEPAADRTEELAARFASVVDATAAGCDPTGEAACGPDILDAAADDTLLVFPSGEYRIDETLTLFGFENFGIRGDAEDVTFVAPPDFNGRWLMADRGRELVVENLTLDVRASNSAPSVKLGVTDRLEVRDIEIVGRGMRTESEPGSAGNVPVGTAFLPVVRSSDGVGIVERFVAKTGGRIGTYNGGEGRVGIYIGQSNRGQIRLVDCHIEEFGNNGVYASRTYGEVQVVGGTYRNNDISQVRLGSEGSFVEAATVEVDVEDVGDPNDPGDFLNPRGVRIESGPVDTAGATARNVDIHLKNSPSAGIVVGRGGGRFRVEDTRIQVDTDGSTAILAKRPTGGGHDPPPEPHHVTISGVTITGDANGEGAIQLLGRPDSTIETTTVAGTGDGRDGVVLTDSPTTIAGSRIESGRYPLVVRATEPATGGCLVALEDVRLATAGADGGELLVFPSQLGFRSPFPPAGDYCVPADLLSEAAVDGEPVLAFSGTRLDGLYGRVATAEEYED